MNNINKSCWFDIFVSKEIFTDSNNTRVIVDINSPWTNNDY